ncbi:MAG: hypothetical protein JSW20_00450 [Nitrospiraceae bacterium]|nr:MAG: hypothetical protein JSW20_00450 [Nitrospiraceae bacterium]
MRNIKLLLVNLLTILIVPVTSVAVDHGGCLTCHKYPGLVRMEKPDTFKVMHIDEEIHLASDHGTVDCRKCHPTVTQIPHTGETAVNCTTGCHTEDRDKIDALYPGYKVNYHKLERFAITKLDDKSSCRVCHPLYPHSNNKKVRALLNMHTGFMLCEVCHLKKEDLKQLQYDWNDPEHFEYVGEPYGTITDRSSHNSNKAIQEMLKMSPDSHKSDEPVEANGALISRIAVFSKKSGKKKILMNTADSDKAREYMSKESSLSNKEKKDSFELFHKNIARKEVSIACNECHVSGGMMDFEKLGFGEKRSKDLQYLNIKSLVTKYDTFYFPNLFGN